MESSFCLFFVKGLGLRGIAEARLGVPEEIRREVQKRIDKALLETLQRFALRTGNPRVGALLDSYRQIDVSQLSRRRPGRRASA